LNTKKRSANKIENKSAHSKAELLPFSGYCLSRSGFFTAVEELYGTRYQSGSFSLINVGSGFHCLRSFSFLLYSSRRRRRRRRSEHWFFTSTLPNYST
jgi:hypothetical protein